MELGFLKLKLCHRMDSPYRMLNPLCSRIPGEDATVDVKIKFSNKSFLIVLAAGDVKVVGRTDSTVNILRESDSLAEYGPYPPKSSLRLQTCPTFRNIPPDPLPCGLQRSLPTNIQASKP